MKQAILSWALAAALIGAAASSHADPSAPVFSPSTQVASSPDQALAKQHEMESHAVKAYENGVNPLASAHFSGVYDQEDAFKGVNGYPLPGTYMNNGDTNAFGGG